jgi:hypothetical protein
LGIEIHDREIPKNLGNLGILVIWGFLRFNLKIIALFLHDFLILIFFRGPNLKKNKKNPLSEGSDVPQDQPKSAYFKATSKKVVARVKFLLSKSLKNV